MSLTSDLAVETEISRIESLSIYQLREFWKARLGAVPKHQSADLLRRRLAYQLQVEAYSGLKPETRRKLKMLYQAFNANPNFVALPTHAFAPGIILTRRWRGETHKVQVLDDGFEYDSKNYKSLTQIAEVITGSKRSGPAFFGFREPRR